jgi:predicted patatin/cPLA2 family phospholipase
MDSISSDKPLYCSPTEPGYRPSWEGATIVEANLVLEGGAMRGAFTAGVLDYLLDEGVTPRCAIGVSAGALVGYNYVAGARGRSCYLNTKYCTDWRYFSMRSFMLTGNAFNVRFVFDRIPNKLESFDYDGFRHSPLRLTAVCSNLQTGEADYTVVTDPVAHLPYVRASASMPMVSKIVTIDNKLLLDGGAADSVPLTYSQLTGANRHVVVLTQHDGFEKKPNRLMPLIQRRYAKYPHYVERLKYRHVDYNRAYRQAKRMAEAGEIFLLRPPMPVDVASMEHDPAKIRALYEVGYEQTRQNFSALTSYLGL